MDVFGVRQQLIADYREFTSSFVDVRDARIKGHVDRSAVLGHQWPDPWLSLNPSFASGGTVDELVSAGLLHPDCARVFRIKQSTTDLGHPLRFHRHQRDAIEVAATGASYVLTTGTGSGKSLSYLVPIVDRVLRAKADGSYRPGVKAIIVYPMNALANSQKHELEKFLRWGFADGQPLVRFDRYTGQEDQEERRRIMTDPPDILLTNYVMLELVLTRHRERQRLIRAARGLWFLVLDELHTYRGRQRADVAFLVRRTRDACAAPEVQCVGTSATMTSRGSVADQRAEVARVATRLFGTTVRPEHVVGESLRRITTEHAPVAKDLAGRLAHWAVVGEAECTLEEFGSDPVASWVETVFGLDEEPGTGRLVRRRPLTVPEAARALAAEAGHPLDECQLAIEAVLRTGARVIDPDIGRPVFAFRLHQFLSKGDNVYTTIEPPATRYITSRKQVVSPDSTDAERKILLPLAFCRECGQEYLIARRTAAGFEAREDSDALDDTAGYLYVSEDQPWPETFDIALADGRLPYSWTLLGDGGQVLLTPGKEKYLPELLHVDSSGGEVERVGLRRGEHHRCQLSPRPKSPVHSRQCRGRLDEQHQAETTDHRIETAWGYVQLLRRTQHGRDIGQPGRAGLAFHVAQHRVSDVVGHYLPF